MVLKIIVRKFSAIAVGRFSVLFRNRYILTLELATQLLLHLPTHFAHAEWSETIFSLSEKGALGHRRAGTS